MPPDVPSRQLNNVLAFAFALENVAVHAEFHPGRNQAAVPELFLPRNGFFKSRKGENEARLTRRA